MTTSFSYSAKTQQLLEQLDIQHPIFKAPMAGTSTPVLAAAVSNAGGLGALGLGAHSIDAARQAIHQTKALTDKPFQLNFFCHESIESDPIIEQQWINYLAPYFEFYNAKPPAKMAQIYPSFLDNDERLQLVLEEKPKAVSFHFGIPTSAQIQAIKQAGILLFATATNLPEAQLIEQAGLDGIIAQGVQAGGHRGTFNASVDSGLMTDDLVTLLSSQINIPIIATGGVMNGADIQRVLNLGASAAQLGTAFVICPESAASQSYRQRLLDPSKQMTQITASISGRPARGLVNNWQNLIDAPHRPPVAAYPYAYDLAKQLIRITSQNHNDDFSVMWAGSEVHRLRNLDAATLMQTLIMELRADMK
jgi:nitronate monooxygenase